MTDDDGRRKSWLAAVLLSLFLGGLGMDRLYLGYRKLAILKLMTGGGCGIWWVTDLALILLNRVPDFSGGPLRR